MLESSREKCGVPHDFVELAIRLLSASFSSASIQIFLTFIGIQTKIRNCLGEEKTAKLVYCHRILQGLRDLDG